MTIDLKSFGLMENGRDTKIYTITNQNGMTIQLSDLGATLVSVEVPDKSQKLVDVVLGYDTALEYETMNKCFLGAVVGRNANRIKKGWCNINGKLYQLDLNDGENNLHSGINYYHQRKWLTRRVSDDGVIFYMESADGDQGYPGNLEIEVEYLLTNDNELIVEYRGVTDEDTIVNMTNHSYFNMDGQESGSAEQQSVWIDADYYTENDEESIPTGEILPVKGTPMDFTKKKKIGKDIDADYEALKLAGGYDHNWVLKTDGKFKKVAEITGAKSGITMTVSTDLPGIQFYTGNYINSEKGKGGVVYQKRQGVCFETQYFPDAVNQESFKQPILKEGEQYITRTSFQFSVK